MTELTVLPTNAPARGWSSQPSLTSADSVSFRTKDAMAADARDAATTNPYGKSAARSTVDSVIGVGLTLNYTPAFEILGVSDDEAAEYSDMIETMWNMEASSPSFHFDAQRKQTFDGLMRTAYESYYVAGETLATIEWKPSQNGTRTCLHFIDPERLSDPRGMPDLKGGRRMGVERDKQGAATGYYIRKAHPADGLFFGGMMDQFAWTYHRRFTPWGRPNILHFYEPHRPDTTRGLSSFTTALLPMRMLQDYTMTELEAAAVRATYAAVVESQLDWATAMEVIGAKNRESLSNNPILDVTMQMVAENREYYRGQEFKFGKSKVAHLLPNEKLHMVQGTQSASALVDYNKVNLYAIASALGVDYATLTKDFSNTNYSGARAALFDVWRSYEVRRNSFVSSVPQPFFGCWLEEKIALCKTIPMLGKKSFYEVRDAITHCDFVGWGKPRLDPLKENQADKVLVDMGALSIPDVCTEQGRDYRAVLRNVKRFKDYSAKLKITPEDINWNLRAQQIKAGAKQSKDSASTDGEA